MNFASMQLTRLRLVYVSIDSNPDWKPMAEILSLPLVGFEVITLQRANESPTFRLFLTVRVPATDVQSDLPVLEVPYSVNVRVAATFAFLPEPKLDEKAMRRMIAFNGLAILYAFARDTIHQITAQAEHGPFLLPVFNITEVSNRLLQQAPTQTDQDSFPAPLQSP